MATQFTQVDELPVLNQADFPAFPEIPAETTLLIFQSEWRNAEREWAAGIVITACIRAGEWKAVDAPTFMSLLQNPMFTFSAQGIVNAVWAFGEEGLVKMVQVGETQYIVPTPELARIALAETNKLRVTN